MEEFGFSVEASSRASHKRVRSRRLNSHGEPLWAKVFCCSSETMAELKLISSLIVDFGKVGKVVDSMQDRSASLRELT